MSHGGTLFQDNKIKGLGIFPEGFGNECLGVQPTNDARGTAA
jgi:hypothetical protein